MTRAFMFAGASRVVVSLLNVNDVATAELMRAFYGNLKSGQRYAEALRAAKLSLLRSSTPAIRHPYFWAPFILVGEF
jgi:CHAT domain-containing protein